MIEKVLIQVVPRLKTAVFKQLVYEALSSTWLLVKHLKCDVFILQPSYKCDELRYQCF